MQRYFLPLCTAQERVWRRLLTMVIGSAAGGLEKKAGEIREF
jgi:hypothetical protein